jgi:UDP-2,4-diacetamido-2,4,6-trideoxy-beta-L-altropyranose hydrolase/UDP-4-amino-4,6-dideoxy-N-acetyl-beta-L-altrosamine N-acetyltransferase
MKQKIIFRADAGQNIGYGHFIRSLALADMLKNDFDVSFATVNPTDYQKSEMEKVCPYQTLNEETHFDDFLQLLTGNETAVLDNYFFTTEYQKAIKVKGCRLVCIDDMHDRHYVADVVINHGADNPSLFSVEPYTQLCLGLEWALLRKPFIEAARNNGNKKNVDKTEHIVLAFGGVDQYRLTDKFIVMLQQNDDIQQIDAIVGNEYKTVLSSADLSRVRFHRAVSAQEVVNLFSNCDLAVLSASTVCLEALACGAKVAAGYYVDNQKEFYEYLIRNGYVYGMGNLLNVTQIDIPPDNNSISYVFFVSSNQKHIEMFKSLKTDGKETIHDMVLINYTDASPKLLKEIHCARNTDIVRFSMENSEIFSFEEHLDFIEKLRTNNDKKYWAVCHGEDYIGSVYLNSINETQQTAEWGIFINPHLTGKGYGTKMADSFFQYLAANTSLSALDAKVKTTNEKSFVFHQNIGFKINETNDVYHYMKRTINKT